jgi:hypothetical protein
MTETIQPRSWKTTVYATDKDSHIQKPETEDNKNILLTFSHNLSILYENINAFNYLIERYVSESKKLEQILNTMKAQEE